MGRPTTHSLSARRALKSYCQDTRVERAEDARDWESQCKDSASTPASLRTPSKRPRSGSSDEPAPVAPSTKVDDDGLSPLPFVPALPPFGTALSLRTPRKRPRSRMSEASLHQAPRPETLVTMGRPPCLSPYPPLVLLLLPAPQKVPEVPQAPARD